METFRNSPSTEIEEEVLKSEEEKSKKMRIKIVLRKEEVEWLMFELQKTQGKKLEDVLQEIQRSRDQSAVPWKPSLDSIVETPELLEGMSMDR